MKIPLNQSGFIGRAGYTLDGSPQFQGSTIAACGNWRVAASLLGELQIQQLEGQEFEHGDGSKVLFSESYLAPIGPHSTMLQCCLSLPPCCTWFHICVLEFGNRVTIHLVTTTLLDRQRRCIWCHNWCMWKEFAMAVGNPFIVNFARSDDSDQPEPGHAVNRHWGRW